MRRKIAGNRNENMSSRCRVAPFLKLPHASLEHLIGMWEPGFWNLTDTEAAAFRAYLLKGGFAVFEDFDGPQQWAVFDEQMHRVLPEARFVKLDNSHPIFDSFFTIHDIDSIVHPTSPAGRPLVSFVHVFPALVVL